MKITIEHLRQIIKETLDHPLKPPSPLKCAECGKKLTARDKQSYEANGCEGYPEVCEYCAESSDVRECRLFESHARITPQEMRAWSKGNWGFVDESVMGDKYMSAEDAQEYIESMDGDEVTEVDIVDEDSGEVYLSAGDEFRKSPWNVDHKADKQRALEDPTYAKRFGLPYECPECGEDVYPEEYDIHSKRCGKTETFDDEPQEDDYNKLVTAVEEFAENWLGMSGELDAQGLSAEDAAQDAYVNFFYDYPDWKKWASAAGMTKADVMSLVTDLVYDAINR